MGCWYVSFCEITVFFIFIEIENIEVILYIVLKGMKLKFILNVMLINVYCIKFGIFSISKWDIIFFCFLFEICFFIGFK